MSAISNNPTRADSQIEGVTTSPDTTNLPTLSDTSNPSKTSNTTNIITEKNQGSISSLLEYPTAVICSHCAEVIVIPSGIWLWTCSKGHIDNTREYACKTCAETCPTNLPWPTIECAKCKATTTIPKTEIAALLKGGVYTIRSAVKSVIEEPATFHCSCCNTLLLIPRGPWKCTACETMNAIGHVQCMNCSYDRYEQHILCGKCGKSTSIPKSGILDSLRAGFTELGSGLHRSWLDVTGQAHIDCPKCDYAIKLPSNITPNTLVKCSNCYQESKVLPANEGRVDSGNYVKLQETSNSPSASITTRTNDTSKMQFRDALSAIDQSTSEFSKAPSTASNIATNDDFSMHKVTYEPQKEKEEEPELINSFANSV